MKGELHVLFHLSLVLLPSPTKALEGIVWINATINYFNEISAMIDNGENCKGVLIFGYLC